VRDDPVAKFDEPDEWTVCGELDGTRMPVSIFQGKEYCSASRNFTTIGGNDLHRLAGLLAERGSHGGAGTLLEGYDLKSLLMVMSPEPGGNSPSEVSPPVPDEPMLPFHGAHVPVLVSSSNSSTAMIAGETN
jgi:hypothetical protein